jgi:hypothetical protein
LIFDYFNGVLIKVNIIDLIIIKATVTLSGALTCARDAFVASFTVRVSVATRLKIVSERTRGIDDKFGIIKARFPVFKA